MQRNPQIPQQLSVSNLNSYLAVRLVSKANIYIRDWTGIPALETSELRERPKSLFPELSAHRKLPTINRKCLDPSRSHQIHGAFSNPRFAFTKRRRLSKGVSLLQEDVYF